MADHDRAVERFLEPWRRRKEVVGALLCGSYVTGAPTRHSDLDLHVVLAPRTGWQERGNRIIDGHLIEYFANPPEALRAFYRSDRERRRLMTATMFATGRVLFDEGGHVRSLVRAAVRELARPFAKLSRREVERAKYLIWDSLDNLEEAFERGPFAAHAYHDHVQGVYADYASFLRQPVLPAVQVDRYLQDPVFRRKLRLRAFPDRRFRARLLEALAAKQPARQLAAARALSEHAIRRMGGLEIDGFRVRFPLQTS